MNDNLLFVLDSNVFMEASRRYYPFDFAKPFWNSIKEYAQEGLICSIDKVGAEIKKGNDLLKNWSETDFDAYFLSTNEPDILATYTKIVNWAQVQSQFNQRAKDVFMENTNADAWAIAFALSKKITIVTHEIYSSEAQKRIPIPNVCEGFDIEYCDTFEMLRNLNFQF